MISQAVNNTEAYHLMELRIANDPADPRRKMPPILSTDRRILDVGCGAGQTLIASHLPAGSVAAGVDVDRAALAFGRKLDKAIQLACAKGEFLPFQDDAFDLVFSRVAVPYMNIPRALSEMFRVLKPGGRLWVTLHPWSMTARDLLRSCRRFDARRIGSRLVVMANGVAVMTLGMTLPLPFTNGRTESFQTRRGITRQLHRIGFDDVEFAQGNSFTVSARKSSCGR